MKKLYNFFMEFITDLRIGKLHKEVDKMEALYNASIIQLKAAEAASDPAEIEAGYASVLSVRVRYDIAIETLMALEAGKVDAFSEYRARMSLCLC
jgi:hypothetical protein